MTSVVAVKKQVIGIKQILDMSDKPEIWIVLTFGPDDQPHGKYGFRKINMKGKKEPVLVHEELTQLERHYAELPECAKRQHEGYSWATFEDFLKNKECKCGRVHPYYGDGGAAL